jgi:hypothetical protein
VHAGCKLLTIILRSSCNWTRRCKSCAANPREASSAREASLSAQSDGGSKTTSRERCEISMQKRLDRLERMISMLQKRHCPEHVTPPGSDRKSSTTSMECDKPMASIESDETDDEKLTRKSSERS